MQSLGDSIAPYDYTYHIVSECVRGRSDGERSIYERDAEFTCHAQSKSPEDSIMQRDFGWEIT